MNKAQEYLIENGLSDRILSDSNDPDPKKWVYASDVMMDFNREKEITHEKANRIDKYI